MMIYCGIDGQRGEYAVMDRREREREEEEKKTLSIEHTYRKDMMVDES